MKRLQSRALPTRTLVSAFLVLSACAPASFAAQAPKDAPYPSKAIRFVVPFPPGGTPDVQSRMLADKLAPRLGQPIVIDNRGGGGGILGMEIVARAPADGYTIVNATVGSWAVTPHLYALPYDVLRDFIPVIQIATTPGLLVVHPTVNAKSVKELIAVVREKPGQLNYASGGTGGFSHMSGELFNYMAKVKITGVPYKGAAPAMNDLIGGHVHVMFNTVITTLPHVKGGRLRAIAATSARRIPGLADVPTIAESGVPGYENSSWTGIGVAARTPRAVVQRLNSEFSAVLQMPEIQERHTNAGSVIVGGTPEQFRDYVRIEHAKFGKLVKEAGIRDAAGPGT
jgi:tripartite-type tricarboxylate transporter receptor subunit TctC